MSYRGKNLREVVIPSFVTYVRRGFLVLFLFLVSASKFIYAKVFSFIFSCRKRGYRRKRRDKRRFSESREIAFGAETD